MVSVVSVVSIRVGHRRPIVADLTGEPQQAIVDIDAPAAHKVKPALSFANTKSARGKFHWTSQWVEEMNEEVRVVLIVTSTVNGR